MATTKLTSLLKLGASAPDFDLPGIDGRNHSLTTLATKKILVIIFTCNHCPYVQGWEGRMIQLQRDFAPQGVQIVGINSNDTKNYPEDSFEKMVERADSQGFNFIYLRDEDQSIARKYDAACTPEVYVFDASRKLRYHGRVDDNHQDPKAVKHHDLKNALEDLVSRKEVRVAETPALGCSIKWS